MMYKVAAVGILGDGFLVLDDEPKWHCLSDISINRSTCQRDESVTHLELQDCSWSKRTLKSAFPNLRSVRVFFTTLPDQPLHLSSFGLIQDVSVEYTGAEGVLPVSKVLKSLGSLTLRRVALDTGTEAVLQLKNLSMTDCNLDDFHISAMPNLRRLELIRPVFTKEGVPDTSMKNVQSLRHFVFESAPGHAVLVSSWAHSAEYVELRGADLSELRTSAATINKCQLEALVLKDCVLPAFSGRVSQNIIDNNVLNLPNFVFLKRLELRSQLRLPRDSASVGCDDGNLEKYKIFLPEHLNTLLIDAKAVDAETLEKIDLDYLTKRLHTLTIVHAASLSKKQTEFFRGLVADGLTVTLINGAD